MSFICTLCHHTNLHVTTLEDDFYGECEACPICEDIRVELEEEEEAWMFDDEDCDSPGHVGDSCGDDCDCWGEDD